MSKLLLIDAGNTRVKWIIVEPEIDLVNGLSVLESGAVLTAEVMSKLGLAMFASKIAELTLLHGVKNISLGHVLGPTWLQEFREALSPQVLNCPQPGESEQLSTRYKNPSQLGQDRWLASLAVAFRTHSPLNLVVSLGTATTIDGVVESRLAAQNTTHAFVHLGGTITPGIQTMLASLNQSTQQLPLAKPSQNDWPTSTDKAIGDGVLSSQVSLIESKARLLEQEYPGHKLTIWLSGGFADDIHLAQQWDVVRASQLVFEGLCFSQAGVAS